MRLVRVRKREASRGAGAQVFSRRTLFGGGLCGVGARTRLVLPMDIVAGSGVATAGNRGSGQRLFMPIAVASGKKNPIEIDYEIIQRNVKYTRNPMTEAMMSKFRLWESSRRRYYGFCGTTVRRDVPGREARWRVRRNA